MAYTPELTNEASCTLRRIAWALDMPMSKAIQIIFSHLPLLLDTEKVCQACRDKTRCSSCAFNKKNNRICEVAS